MMVLGKTKEFMMKHMLFMVCVLLAIMTLIASVTFYKYNELLAIKMNIESAIAKGIDPIAVRCAYSKESDLVCVAHGITASNQQQKPTK